MSEHFGVDLHTIFQVSTTGALVEGVYQKAVSSHQLLQYGDFGLGTFENLDGEMVVLDGEMYQTTGDGVCRRVTADVGTPFAVVLYFKGDVSWSVDEVLTFNQIMETCDQHRDTNNLFYAFRVDGRFSHVRTRAMQPAAPKGPPSKT